MKHFCLTVTLTQTQTLMVVELPCELLVCSLEQFGVQCFAQGHSDIQISGGPIPPFFSTQRHFNNN